MKYIMKKMGAILVLIIIFLVAFNRTEYHITYDNKHNFKLLNIDFGNEVEGHILDIDNNRLLVVGTNVNMEYNQLAATYTGLSNNILYDQIEIGTRVKYIGKRMTLASYLGQGGIEIIDIIDRHSNGKSSEEEIIQKSIEVLNERNKKRHSLFAVNSIVLENEIWKLGIVEHRQWDDLDFTCLNFKMEAIK